MSTTKDDSRRVLASNRRAHHDYHLLEKFEAGIVLSGTEVKSIRLGRIQLKESHVEIRDGEAWLVGAHVSPYSHGNRENHDPEGRRKLLLKRREIDKLFNRTVLKGATIVPLSVYLSGNLIKVEIAVAQGKKRHDKRQAEKEKELDREAREAMKTRTFGD
jgi:SsrA-binding protein